nr:TSUP family transporter [Gammaproteobacteria bacterium]
MIEDPRFYLLAVPAVLILGVSKGGFGGGLGSLAVPMVALVVSPVQAAAVLLPILCVMDVHGAWVYRWRWDPANLKILMPAAIVGLAVGTATFRYLNADTIRILIGGVAVGFTLHHWIGSRVGGRA